jgi:deoxyribodipyrimidine photo-lyase
MNDPARSPWAAAIVWFRRDLRVDDHPALVEAVRDAATVVPLFVLDDRFQPERAPRRDWFLRRSLVDLDASLRARGSQLLVIAGRPDEVVPSVARAVGAEVVLASRDVTRFAHQRDGAVAVALAREGRRLVMRPGLLLVEPETLLTADREPFRVFTPFWRALERQPRRMSLTAPTRVPTPARIPVGGPMSVGRTFDVRAMAALPPPHAGLLVPGEAAANERLQAWVRGGVARYGQDRDLLSGDGSAHLSADLHFGTLSPGQVESAALAADADASPFVRQLAWREFYHHQAFHHRTDGHAPASVPTSALNPDTQASDAVEAWREGRTGIPVVDAAMRQLAETGWLSNRARLVTASFLTRHLLVDWRIGERHFLHHLVDGDVANNRGGWQWVAGVGPDAQPWFRIMNPVRQGERFDPEGSWVRRWVPELAGVPARHIHAPWTMPEEEARDVGVRLGASYPRPIVDLADARARALEAFRSGQVGARVSAAAHRPTV